MFVWLLYPTFQSVVACCVGVTEYGPNAQLNSGSRFVVGCGSNKAGAEIRSDGRSDCMKTKKKKSATSMQKQRKEESQRIPRQQKSAARRLGCSSLRVGTLAPERCLVTGTLVGGLYEHETRAPVQSRASQSGR